jgi:hypothetical protein
MAYYYFDFRDLKKQNRLGLLSSLISQLSVQSNSCFDVLSRLYSNNPSNPAKPGNIALIKCIKDMLDSPQQGQVYIVIDALDECPDTSGMPSSREQVLGVIHELVSLDLANLHLCVTSRPEIDIRKSLEPLRPLEISLHDEEGQKRDIAEYIRFVVYSDPKMRSWREDDKKLVINTLSERADGMYAISPGTFSLMLM